MILEAWSTRVDLLYLSNSFQPSYTRTWQRPQGIVYQALQPSCLWCFWFHVREYDPLESPVKLHLKRILILSKHCAMLRKQAGGMLRVAPLPALFGNHLASRCLHVSPESPETWMTRSIGSVAATLIEIGDLCDLCRRSFLDRDLWHHLSHQSTLLPNCRTPNANVKWPVFILAPASNINFHQLCDFYVVKSSGWDDPFYLYHLFGPCRLTNFLVDWRIWPKSFCLTRSDFSSLFYISLRQIRCWSAHFGANIQGAALCVCGWM